MTRDLPPALCGPACHIRRRLALRADKRAAAAGSTDLRRTLRLGLAALAAAAVGVGGVLPLAYADELTDKRDQVSQQIQSTNAQVSSANQELSAASQALAQSQQQLAQARDQLAETQQQLKAAQKADDASAAKLADAQNELEKAKAQVAEGQRNVDAQQQKVGNVARTQYQQRTGLVGIGMLVTGERTSDVSNRVQWSTTVFDTTQSELDKLHDTQRQLTEAKDRQVEIERQMAAERAAAAANLDRSEHLQSMAEQQSAAVAALVKSNASAEDAAKAQLAAEEQHLQGLTAERTQVEQRIAERVAQEKAEAARKAEEARKAREAAAAAKAAAAAAASKSSSAKAAKATAAAKSADSGAVNATSQSSNAHHGFIYPAEAPITSPYGMRLHPVTGVYKLHDGTDFGASCGAPIKAAADGVVKERYFNAGYGNRLMIDHGKVDGRFVTTGYNHAVNYIVNVGQHVTQGQTIGYVGTTGYSTGCHLHLMVWLDGELTNPMSWY